jgi:magnesium-transporting ATPase (P-type)
MITKIKEGLSTYIHVFFFLAVATALVMSTGLLTVNDKFLLKRSFWRNLFSLRGWLGGGILSGIKFSILVVIAGAIVLAIGIRKIPLGNKSSIIILTFCTILSFVVALGLLCRFLSINRLTRGKSLPGIISTIILTIVLVAPLAISELVHHNEERPIKTSVDLISFFSPLKSISAIIYPTKTLDAIPYCKELLGNLPLLSLLHLFIYSLFLSCILYSYIIPIDSILIVRDVK